MKKLLVVTENRYLGDIDETLEVQELITGNGDLIQITKTDAGFKITNGMNGYGDNTRADWEDAKIYTID